MIDAKEVSAAHRARYFWGNLPGMNRLVRAPCPGGRGWVSAGRMTPRGGGQPPLLTSLLLCRVLLCFLFLEEEGESGVENTCLRNQGLVVPNGTFKKHTLDTEEDSSCC